MNKARLHYETKENQLRERKKSWWFRIEANNVKY